MDKFESQWMRGILRMRQSDIYYIPMWQNIFYLKEDFIAGGSELIIDEEYMYNLYNCDAIEIFRRDDVLRGDINIVRNIESFTKDSIGLRVAINENLSKENTYIYPLIKCTVQPTDMLRYVYSNGSNAVLNFEDVLYKPLVQIPYEHINDYQIDEHFNPYNLPDSVEGKLVLPFTPQWLDDESQTFKVEKNVQRLDTETGIFEYDLKNTTSYDIHTMDIYLMSKKMINNMIRFFKRVSGMYKSFYAPTWANDIEIYGDIVAGRNFIYSKFNQFYNFYATNTRRKKIVVFTRSGKAHIFDVLTYGYEIRAGVKYGKIIFSSTFTNDIYKEDILMISYLNLVRFDSDELKLDYESNIVAHTSLVLKEVDDI